MNPAIGERLGFAITVILAMLAQKITASGLMPVCNFRVHLEYLNIVSMLFGAVSVLETGVVLYLYHQEAENWIELLIPDQIEHFIAARVMKRQQHSKMQKRKSLQQTLSTRKVSTLARSRTGTTLSRVSTPLMEKRASTISQVQKKGDSRIRKQLYRQLFFVLDKDFSGKLNIEEIADFLETVGVEHSNTAEMEASSGDSHNLMFADLAHLENLARFMEVYDVNADASLDFEEFCQFCDIEFAVHGDIGKIEKIINGFLQVVDRRRQTRVAMWQARALFVDQFARWTIPGGFLLFLIWLYNLDSEDLRELYENSSYQALFILSGVVPVSCVLCAFLIAFALQSAWQRACKRRKHNGDERSSNLGIISEDREHGMADCRDGAVDRGDGAADRENGAADSRDGEADRLNSVYQMRDAPSDVSPNLQGIANSFGGDSSPNKSPAMEIPIRNHKSSSSEKVQMAYNPDDSPSLDDQSAAVGTTPFSIVLLREAFSEAQLPSEYLAKAHQWCSQNGLVELEELGDVNRTFADALGLKLLERRRLMKTMLRLGWLSQHQLEFELRAMEQPPPSVGALQAFQYNNDGGNDQILPERGNLRQRTGSFLYRI
eukprot:gnl/MRDRNA2_/MRDRNA2_113903_c0_seq1.p1 gnl/MRDRNA2_/MRDRNA2_113903_c0~~gnl/MRDRNA2_/MRDRNA2_113903_c0_seq1.p1  ORF type:complete len:615 (-),score=86.54 gnl/MRDRNA2_/MRDRNA2_113903_c0_seq1:16-1824(-)